MSQNPVIVWFRKDLRRADNPALHAAYESGAPVLPVFILDDNNPPEHLCMGAASRVWLHHSLQSLDESLSNHLYLAKGDAGHIIPALAQEIGATGVYWNRMYEGWVTERDHHIKDALADQDIAAHSFNGSLLWEPWETRKDDDTPYKVYSPFFKNALMLEEPRKPLPAPDRLRYAKAPDKGETLDKLGLLPPKKEGGWGGTMVDHWTIGEDGAWDRLKKFAKHVDDYKDGRNIPADEDGVSRLSPRLHFGELSPNQIWHHLKKGEVDKKKKSGRDTFLSELVWREFNYNLLYHFPKATWDNMQEKFNDFPWSAQESEALDRWRHGRTGYPIIDAAMRELWETGWMHNRCRMIVGSFLVKNLLTHWHQGEQWFWDCLVDADAASNKMNWQWVAGCGADAAPYFRIFNPVLQSKKFDPDGKYIRRWVPELKDVPNEHLHEPWEAVDDLFADIDYPKPVVDLFESRDRALEAYNEIKG